MVELEVKRASIFSRSGFPIKIQKSTISCSNTTTFRHDSGCGDRSSYLVRGIFSEKNSKESFSKINIYNFVLEHYSFRTDSGCGDDSIRSYSKHFFREKLKSQFQKFPKAIISRSKPGSGGGGHASSPIPVRFSLKNPKVNNFVLEHYNFSDRFRLRGSFILTD